MDLDLKTIYEEAGRFHRYQLGWRQAMFAGYFAYLYGVANLALSALDKDPKVLPVILIVASPLGFLLKAGDERTRDLYGRAQETAQAMEIALLEKNPPEPPRLRGFYENLTDDRQTRAQGEPGPHTVLIARTYFWFSIGLLALGLYHAWYAFR